MNASGSQGGGKLPNAMVMRSTSLDWPLPPVHTPAFLKKAHRLLGYGVGRGVVVGAGFGAAGRRGTGRLREAGAAAARAMDGASSVTINSAG